MIICDLPTPPFMTKSPRFCSTQKSLLIKVSVFERIMTWVSIHRDVFSLRCMGFVWREGERASCSRPQFCPWLRARFLILFFLYRQRNLQLRALFFLMVWDREILSGFLWCKQVLQLQVSLDGNNANKQQKSSMMSSMKGFRISLGFWETTHLPAS